MGERQEGDALRGKVVVITGGARGIGLATAKALVARGAKIALGDIDARLAHAEAVQLGGYGGALDVRDRGSFASFLDAATQALGPVDVLVNNAGIMPAGGFLDLDAALDEAQIDINFRGVVHGCRLVLPGMLARNTGHIINVASLAGRFALPGLAVYCGTKFAVVGLTESLASEYRRSGIEFSMIMPAKVRTELASGTERADKGLPIADPEEVAEVIVATLLKPKLFVAVPQYMETVSGIFRLMPEGMAKRIRRMIRDDRALTRLDSEKRAGYDQRLRKLSATGRSSGK